MLVLKIYGRLENFSACKLRILQTVYIHIQLCFVYTAAFLGLPQSGKNQEETTFFMIREKSVNFFVKSGKIFGIVKVSELYPLCTHNPLKSIKRLKMK